MPTLKRGTIFSFLVLVAVFWLSAHPQIAAQQPAPTLVPSWTPSPTTDIKAMVEATLTALAPTGTPAPATTGEATEEPIHVTLAPLAGQQISPPLAISLPEGWQSGFDVLVLGDADGEIRGIPLAVYAGPVTGGTGYIVLLWGFPSLTAGNPFIETTPEPDLWADGLRLLRLAVIEPGCNIGTDLKRSYRVGNRAAVGAQFAAVTCPENLPDTRGWFAGVQENGLNFIFYIYTDPIEAMDTGKDQLQTILDTVQFHVPERTPEAGSN